MLAVSHDSARVLAAAVRRWGSWRALGAEATGDEVASLELESSSQPVPSAPIDTGSAQGVPTSPAPGQVQRQDAKEGAAGGGRAATDVEQETRATAAVPPQQLIPSSSPGGSASDGEDEGGVEASAGDLRGVGRRAMPALPAGRDVGGGVRGAGVSLARAHALEEPSVSVGRAGPILRQSPLKTLQDAPPPPQAAQLFHAATRSPRARHRAASPPASGHDRSHSREVSPPHADGTPQQAPPHLRSRSYAPVRPPAGGVALFGAYHTAGKWLQPELAATLQGRAPRAPHPHAPGQARVATVIDRRPARSRGGAESGGAHDGGGGGVHAGVGVPHIAVNARLLAAPGSYGGGVLAEQVRNLGGGRADQGAAPARPYRLEDADKENNGRVRRAGVGERAAVAGRKALGGEIGKDVSVLIRQLGLSRETLDLVLPLQPARAPGAQV